jgi:hypothetical protein
MAIPPVLYAAALSQALPLLAALTRRGRPVPTPARWILAWCALGLATDLLSLVVAFEQGENEWVQYLAVPLGSAFVLWGLAGWQTSELFRLAYRIAILALVVATMVALLVPHSGPLFDDVVAPFHALVLLAAALHTLLHRTLRSAGTITREPWLWIGLGLSLYFAGSVAIRPFAQALLGSNPEWVRQAWLARAWTTILAFSLITTGILCPLFRRASGGPS